MGAGGSVSKDKFLADGLPTRYFRLKNKYSWISGGLYPAFKDFYTFFENENIGLIVTLTVDPFKPGRNINHTPFDFKDIEWCDTDITQEDYTELIKKFEFFHVPIADAGFPTPENAEKLFNKVKEYHEANPTKTIYFHCWLGQGRTSLATIYILMKYYDMPYGKASLKLQKYYTRAKLTEYQRRWLQNERLTEEEIEKFLPLVRTPQNHDCYIQNGIIEYNQLFEINKEKIRQILKKSEETGVIYMYEGLMDDVRNYGTSILDQHLEKGFKKPKLNEALSESDREDEKKDSLPVDNEEDNGEDSREVSESENDENKQLEIIKFDPHRIDEIKNPSEYVNFCLVEKNPFEIKQIKNPSESVCLTAVRKNGCAIQHIKSPTSKVEFAAINENPHAIQYIEYPTQELYVMAIQKDWRVIQYLKYPSDTFQLLAMEIDPRSIFYINGEISENVQLREVEINSDIIRYFDNPSERVQLEAVRSNGELIKCIKNASERVKLSAVRQNGLAVQYISEPSEDVQLEAVKQNRYALQHISKPTEKVLSYIRRISQQEKLCHCYGVFIPRENATDGAQTGYKQYLWKTNRQILDFKFEDKTEIWVPFHDAVPSDETDDFVIKASFEWEGKGNFTYICGKYLTDKLFGMKQWFLTCIPELIELMGDMPNFKSTLEMFICQSHRLDINEIIYVNKKLTISCFILCSMTIKNWIPL
jgi:protein-tyrosine phosphatase